LAETPSILRFLCYSSVPVGQVTDKPADVTIRESKGAELSQEQGMEHEVKGSRKIKIDSISLTLTTDSRGHNVKE
jgi:hypothetical protein